MKAQIILLILAILRTTAHAADLNDLNEHMKYLAARDMILSQNLANIDTPGYKPQDLKTNNSVDGLGMKITHPGHMTTDTHPNYEFVAGDIVEIKPNGNAVTAEYELSKKNENAIRFTKTANIANKVKEMMKTSMKNPSN